MKKIVALGFGIIFYVSSSAQVNYPQNYFQSPLDTEMVLSGNFGEIRPNHFHAGFDIKTGNREGLSVYAVADGYISRIKISPYGYGKALYITHPNGYTSVYGHLKAFPENIQNFIKTAQESKQSFELDTLLQNTSLLVKKGEVIAYSGNTGGSQGPHLHFEIRETQTEKPVNPYLFGYKVKDTEKPKITQLAIYPLDNFTLINNKNGIKKLVPIYQNGNYILKSSDSLTISGKFGFAIDCYDTETNSINKNGVYSIELQSGGKRIYYCEYEKFSFENARYVNTHIDYVSYKKNNSKLQKCFVSKNNQIELYKDLVDNGVLDFNDDAIHWIKFIVKDFYGNVSELVFKVKGNKKQFSAVQDKITENIFDCSKPNTFKNNDIEITIPTFALYDDLKFNYSSSVKANTPYAPLHHIQNHLTPLQKTITLKLKPSNLPDSLQSKACIISINEKGKINYEGGNYKDGYVVTETKNFGNFTISIDAVAPKLLPMFKKEENGIVNFKSVKSINFKVSDNLSGIKTYNLFIDNKWCVMEFEPKKDLLFYDFEKNITKGTHTLTIEVTDVKGNSTKQEYTFER